MKQKAKTYFNKDSIRVKLTLTLTILIVATIGILWVLNRTFLESYYIKSKAESLGKTYTDLKEVVDTTEDTDVLAETLTLKLMKYSENRNIYPYIFTNGRLFYKNGWVLLVDTPNALQKRIDQYKRLVFSNGGKRIVLNKSYDIFEDYDPTLDTKNLVLVGNSNDKGSSVIILTTTLESMRESVTVANQFLAYVGLGAVAISILVMLWISKRFTTPILQLAGIAKKMSDLDFDVKYNVKTQDELGELGSSINTLSERLESTISELKKANNELLSDLQNKVQIDEMRKDFLSNVTHELKTPIALIQGYAEGLKDNINDDEDSREFYCEVIVDEAQKMNTMVKKLLSLNQIEFGNNQPGIERFDLTALVTSVIHSTEILMEQKKVTLHFVQTEPLYVWADEYMIEEVLTNYVSNALNHVEDPRIIEIKFIQKKDVVRVAVFNTGIPIPEEDLENIWIKFYKVDKARTREYGGSGIGLSIVKAIMDSHNQKCGAINHSNGVEFWFELDTKAQ